ncbi:hypothetical protein ACFE04_004049 [Oxalis oulophora]
MGERMTKKRYSNGKRERGIGRQEKISFGQKKTTEEGEELGRDEKLPLVIAKEFTSRRRFFMLAFSQLPHPPCPTRSTRQTAFSVRHNNWMTSRASRTNAEGLDSRQRPFIVVYPPLSSSIDFPKWAEESRETFAEKLQVGRRIPERWILLDSFHQYIHSSSASGSFLELGNGFTFGAIHFLIHLRGDWRS